MFGVDEDVVLKPQRRQHETLRFSSDDARRSVVRDRSPVHAPAPPAPGGARATSATPRTVPPTARPLSGLRSRSLETFNVQRRPGPDRVRAPPPRPRRLTRARRGSPHNLHRVVQTESRPSRPLLLHSGPRRSPPISQVRLISHPISHDDDVTGAAAVMCGRAPSRAADDVSMYEPLCTRAIHLLDLMPSRMPSRMQASPSSPM